MLNVSLSHVQRMCERGVIPGWRTGGGHRRIPVDAINALLRERAAAGAIHQQDLGRISPRDTFSSGGEFSILVVEDDTSLLKLYKAKIASWKLPVKLITAEDGYDAIIKILREHPDLLIVDLNLPKLDGFEVIKRVRKDTDFDRMDIIVITGLSPDSFADRGGVPRGVTILGKPVPFSQLLGFVQAGIAARQRVVMA